MGKFAEDGASSRLSSDPVIVSKLCLTESFGAFEEIQVAPVGKAGTHQFSLSKDCDEALHAYPSSFCRG